MKSGERVTKGTSVVASCDGKEREVKETDCRLAIIPVKNEEAECIQGKGRKKYPGRGGYGEGGESREDWGSHWKRKFEAGIAKYPED